MSFRLRTTLALALLTAVALGAAFTAVSAAFNGLQRRQLDASLRAVAYQEAAEAESLGFDFSDGPGPAANDVGPLTKYGLIYDARGRVVSATAPFDSEPPPLDLRRPEGAAFDFWFKGSHFRAVKVPIPRRPGMALFLATSRDDLDGDEAFLFRAMLVAFLVAVGWAAAVAWWMGGRLTRDHHAIAEVARRVAGGDLLAKVSVVSSDPEVAQLGRDVNEMIERLGQLLASQERFVAHAAHELRSPLTALYGELQQALRKERDAAGYKAAIEAALGATRRLKQLTEDLLTLARARAAGPGPGAAIRLTAAVAEATSLVQPIARSRAVTLDVVVDDSCMVGDRNGDVARLLRNLLENAVQHSPESAVVRLRARSDAGKVVVRIEDDGPGVSDAERFSIFEPFYRTPGGAHGQGSGLGLGIAREIARAHGGDVVLEERPSPAERGASFAVSLPIAVTP